VLPSRRLSIACLGVVAWTMSCSTAAQSPSVPDVPPAAVTLTDASSAPTDAVAPTDAATAPADVGAPVDAAAARTLRALHGCAPDGPEVVDMTAMANPVIVSGMAPDGIGSAYTPRCVRLRAGQTLTLRIDPLTAGTWAVHPLMPGWIDDGNEMPDPTSPIPFRDEGDVDVQVVFATGGTYGFYCTRHYLMGHVGTVHVVGR
jgi:plastocyanin